jgi:uncharacterized protein YegP (UPF0339 family)
MKAEYFRSKNTGQWHGRIKSGNNRIVWVTEGYKRRSGVLNAFKVIGIKGANIKNVSNNPGE